MQSISTSVSGFARDRILTPLTNLLKTGATPQSLAWSLAIGCVIGVNPLLGSTTVVCLVVAFVFRLNLIASQIANHIVYPLELALFYVFIRIGDRIFHTGKMPLDRHEMLRGVRMHPWETTKLLWSWEWHALIVWAVFAVVAAPLIALALTPLLKRALVRMHRADPQG
ncbi:hypothetical protein SAMN05421770_101681 [Granulicella rosea]|uniref:DUF2062 domain-containing protein n=1 Tax=Granulicella rosea TaxID=474952 RepID=A0A239DWD2_9BACT|nr:DUF2062 domain-containing protein [Granulicella rosea]SNS36790.1 hypothetical protein SAMN05421770_101681 [Granulicella rosea]